MGASAWHIHETISHAVCSIFGHVLGPIATLLNAIEQLIYGTLNGFEMAKLMFGLTDTLSHFENLLLQGKLGLAVALMAHGFFQAMIKLGHAPLKVAKLRVVAGRMLALLEALGNINKALVHVGQGPHVRTLRHAGGKLFNGHAQRMHVTFRCGLCPCAVDALIKGSNFSTQPLHFPIGGAALARECGLGLFQQTENAFLNFAQFGLRSLHRGGLRLRGQNFR